VADNEVEKQLFLYEVVARENSLRLENRQEVSFEQLPSVEEGEDFALSDIEALASLPSGEVLIYGSHSRNKRCDTKKDRRIFAHGVLNQAAIYTGSIAPIQSKKHSCKRLFGDKRDIIMQKVCDAIEHSQSRADVAAEKPSASEQQSACELEPAFNLEGAVAIPDETGEARIWIGLRAPLVDGHAILLRQVEDRETFSFDAAVFIDLQEFGVRELTFAKGKIFGIAGPSADGDAAHFLWSGDASALSHGATFAPANLGSLPNSAEGLEIVNDDVFVLLDGAEPKDDEEVCKTDSEYIVRPANKTSDSRRSSNRARK
jgi:hypothetical protein